MAGDISTFSSNFPFFLLLTVCIEILIGNLSNFWGDYMRLRLSEDYVIDTDDYRREGLRIAILAMSGHGKSNVAADVVEDVLDQKGQAIVLEPITEWHTLKARYNNVVTVGGEFQDLPLEHDFAREYVHASLENGVNLVVNVSDLEEEAEQRKFVADFLWNLYRSEQKYRRVVFLAIEEADIWAPQMWDQTSKQSLARVSLIAKHGRKIGIFPIFITQRPADFHKSPLSQCNVILFGKFTSSADLDPRTGVMYVVKKLHIPIEEKDIISLETGEFIVWDKFGVHRIKARKRTCPHGADTPLVAPVPFAAGVNQTLGSLKESIEKALATKKREKSEIERLRAEVEATKRENEELRKKADIKIALSEMLKGPRLQRETPDLTAKLQELTKTYEDRIAALEQEKKDKTERIFTLESEKAELLEKFKAYEPLDKALSAIVETKLAARLPMSMPMPVPSTAVVGLQTVTTVVDVPAAIKRVTITEDTVKGKIFALAKKGFFDAWKTAKEVHKKLIDDANYCTYAAVNEALNQLVKDGLFGMKHTDRNRYKLAPNVVFENPEKGVEA